MKHTLITAIVLFQLIVVWMPIGMAKEVDVVLRWAPVIEQQDYSQNPMVRDNVFTVVNFDNDWRLNNNSINLPYHFAGPAVYYSVVESGTHYFIGYYLYYPRHAGVVKHEHDMIGAMVAVRKSQGDSESIDMLLTYSHGKWRKWNGSQACTGNGRLRLVVSADTHEIISIRATDRVSGTGGFYPLLSDTIDRGTSNRVAYSGYRLIDLDELWRRRNDIGQGRVFNRWGYFDSYDVRDIAAPWVWKYKQIQWLAKPAELLQRVQGMNAMPVIYLNNHYR